MRNKSLTDNDDFGESMPRKAKGHSRVGKGGIPQANPFVEMLKEASVEQAVPLRRVAVLDDTNTVSEALKLLAEYGIQSAPVLDLVKRGFLGFVDVLDILSFIVSFFQLGEVLDSSMLFARSQELFAHSITDVIGMSHRLTAVDIQKTTSLWDAIAIFQKGAHRLPITNEDGVIVNLISQTDVLRFLMTQRDYYDNLFESTLEDLKLGRHHAVTIHQDQTTLAALQKMQQGNISALAIVNSHNELVGNLSASDLKGTVIINDDPGSEPLGCLLLPILAFLHQNGKKGIEPFSCTHQTTLGFIMEQMLNLGYHRVWVVDQSRHVKSVITMTDVMRAVIQQKPKFFNEEQKANKMAQQKGLAI